MANAYIALGSNLQNPVRQVQSALAALSKLPHSHVIKASSLYKTAPVGYEAKDVDEIPDFINAVVWLETTLSPEVLLEALFNIENLAGRERPFVNAPRVLDCDLLLYDHVEMQSKYLTIPHTRMHLRGFVLLPLFEINPEIIIGQHGKIADIIAKLNFTDVVQQVNAS